MAVNDNKVNKSGGQHWSLLVYTAKENLWYHYDSLKNFNLEEARFLVGRLQEYIRPGATPSLLLPHVHSKITTMTVVHIP